MKINSKHYSALTLIFPVFNLIILSLYIINFDLDKESKFYYLIILLAILSFISICTIKSSLSILINFRKLQISLSALLFIFLIFEGLYRISPGIFPLQIRNYLATEDIRKARGDMVEFLNESPFVKFKSNENIKSQGYRGTNQQFVYEWKTDNLGFKNTEFVSNQNTVDIVAVGDSFTEGMGVATEKTWPSILTEKGYTTYNLGVQGYAPIQLEGSLRKYGLQLKPKYVIIGYCGSTYRREKVYFNIDEVIKRRKFTGGIQSIAGADIGEIRGQSNFVVSALYLLTEETRSKIHSLLEGDINELMNYPIVNSKFELYKEEIMSIEYNSITEDLKSNPKTWKSTLKAFVNIIKMSNDINAKVILLYLPHRGESYFEKATGKKLPESYFEKIESNMLRKFAKKENIMFLDPSNRLTEYVNNLPDDFDIKSLPFLEIDGHMGNIGHRLVAEEIISLIKQE